MVKKHIFMANAVKKVSVRWMRKSKDEWVNGLFRLTHHGDSTYSIVGNCPAVSDFETQQLAPCGTHNLAFKEAQHYINDYTEKVKERLLKKFREDSSALDRLVHRISTL